MDFTDDVSSNTRLTLNTHVLRTNNPWDMPACGRGTQDSHCTAKSNANFADSDSGPGSLRYNNMLYRNKTIYVNPVMMRSGERCVLPDGATLNLDWYQRDSTATAADILEQICTDGGEGSLRLPLNLPHQVGVWGSATVYSVKLYYYDFLCPYGSQPEACPPRNLTDFQEMQDELVQPSGPEFTSCHDPDVPDYECCRTETAFQVHGGGGFVGQRGIDDQYSCAYPTAAGLVERVEADENGEGAEVGDTCPMHWTSYYHTSTGCAALCRAAHEREGNDDTCVPTMPECSNWHDGRKFPLEFQTVTADCICGAKLRTDAQAGDYVHPGTILARAREYARRALQSDWEWPEAPGAGIDAHHGKTPITSLEHAYTHAHTRARARSHFPLRVQARTLTCPTRASPRS